jgi:hypothetical protein
MGAPSKGVRAAGRRTRYPTQAYERRAPCPLRQLRRRPAIPGAVRLTREAVRPYLAPCGSCAALFRHGRRHSVLLCHLPSVLPCDETLERAWGHPRKVYGRWAGARAIRHWRTGDVRRVPSANSGAARPSRALCDRSRGSAAMLNAVPPSRLLYNETPVAVRTNR